MSDTNSVMQGINLRDTDPVDAMIDRAKDLATRMGQSTLEPALHAILAELFSCHGKQEEGGPLLVSLATALSQYRYGMADEKSRANTEKARADAAEAELARIKGAQVIDAVASEISTNGHAEPTQFDQGRKRA